MLCPVVGMTETVIVEKRLYQAISDGLIYTIVYITGMYTQ
jgi:hypothetical protein